MLNYLIYNLELLVCVQWLKNYYCVNYSFSIFPKILDPTASTLIEQFPFVLEHKPLQFHFPKP